MSAMSFEPEFFRLDDKEEESQDEMFFDPDDEFPLAQDGYRDNNDDSRDSYDELEFEIYEQPWISGENFIKIKAKYPGRCLTCKKDIKEGDIIYWSKGKGIKHIKCV